MALVVLLAAIPACGPGTTAPATMRPAPTTVLVFGDSVALTLGLALGDYAAASHRGTSVVTDAQLGCGIAEGTTVLAGGRMLTLPPACNVDGPPAARWPALLAGDLVRYRPGVVALLAGRWEAFDRPDGAGGTTDILRPDVAHQVAGQLRRFIATASAGGARVVLMTAPYYQPPGGPRRPEDDPARVDAYNRLVRSAAAADPGTASVFRLNALVSPYGRFARSVGPQVVRAPDGIHFPFYSIVDPTAEAPDNLDQVLEFSHWIGPRVLPDLLAAGRAGRMR